MTEASKVERYFCDLMQGDASLSAAIAAMRTLLMVLEETNCKYSAMVYFVWYFSLFHFLGRPRTVATIQELHSEIQKAVQIIRSTDYPITAVVSGSELFLRFITLGKFDDKTMDECKQIMVHRGQVFLTKLLESRKVIAQRGAQFITDGCVSRV